MDIFEAISNETRRKAIKILKEKGKASFSDLMNELGLDSPSLAFHLRKLGDLIEKVNDEYVLTEEGIRAYKIITEVEGGVKDEKGVIEESDQGNFSTSFPSNVIRISNVAVYEISPDLVKSSKENKNKLRIDNIGILKIDDSVSPEDLKEIVDEISNVGVLICSSECSSSISSKMSRVGIITSSNGDILRTFSLLDKLFSGLPTVLPTVGSGQGVFSIGKRKTTVFDSPIQPSKACDVEANGSTLTLTQGEPHLKVECHSPDDAEVNLGDKMELEMDGCSAVLSLPELEKLNMEVDGSKAEVNISVKQVSIEADGSKADLNLAGCREVSIDSDASYIKGKLGFPSGGTLDIDVDASNVVFTLDLPDDVGVASAVDSDSSSYVRVPPMRQGEKNLKIRADVDAGEVVIITTRDRNW